MFVHHEVGLTSVNDAWQFLVACDASLASTHGIQRKAVVDMLAKSDENVCFMGGVVRTSFQVIYEWRRETLQAGRTRRHDKLSTDALCELALHARLFARRSRRARG